MPGASSRGWLGILRPPHSGTVPADPLPSATGLGWVQRDRGVKCEPSQLGEPGHPREARASSESGSRSRGWRSGDPHKGAEGNPGGPREEARLAAGRAQQSALAASPLGVDSGEGAEETLFLRSFRRFLLPGDPPPRGVLPQRGPSAPPPPPPPPRHRTVEGSGAGLPPQLNLLPTRPLAAAPASAGCVPGTAPRPLPSLRRRAAAGCGSCAALAPASPVLPARSSPARPRLPALRARTME